MSGRQPLGEPGEYVDKAKDYARENPEQARSAIDRVEDLIDERTGGRFKDAVDKGGDFLEDQLGLTDTEPSPAPTPAPPPGPAPTPGPAPVPPPEPAPSPGPPPVPTPDPGSTPDAPPPAPGPDVPAPTPDAPPPVPGAAGSGEQRG